LAAAEIMSGQHELTIGGGVEKHEPRRHLAASGSASPSKIPPSPYPHILMPQGVSADLIPQNTDFLGEDVDAYAVLSQRRAAEAWLQGKFSKSIVPVKDINNITLLDRDERLQPEQVI